ncbi:hypothetical protein BDV96DRAFT_641343 [Lophiotrema nucula]|uniref:Secreted protein n=1 Tax=Lophiotrema nucula TaxID=690887 RepID=A0A6A5ZM15_9PLEO|nr:hypothetical protein BDV96DRAFT_641343 [Lophiotrema nucula]
MWAVTLILLLCSVLSEALPTGELVGPATNVTGLGNAEDASSKKCGYVFFDHSTIAPFRDMAWLDVTASDGCLELPQEIGDYVLYQDCTCQFYRKNDQPVHACAQEDYDSTARGPASGDVLRGKKIATYKCSPNT